MNTLHLLSLVLEAIQVIGLLAIPCAIFAERDDPRFEGERLWYRS